MRFRFNLPRRWKTLLAGVAGLGIALPAAQGQGWQPPGWGAAPGMVAPGPHPCPSPYAKPCAPPTGVVPPPAPAPAPTAPPAPAPGAPAPTPTPPPETPTQPAPTTPTPQEIAAPSEALEAAAGAFDTAAFAPESASAVGGGEFTGVGYIDSAIPVSQFRLRFDAAYDDNRPDRADFFYPKCGCFRNPAAGANFDPNAPGPGTDIARRVNYQELSSYLEWAVNPRLSGFAELPLRWVDIAFVTPGVTNDHNSGISDVNFGFKYAMLYSPGEVLTLQLRTYAPTGDATQGLGRNNWNLEPALLYYRRLAPRWIWESEVRDFIPVASADDFAGNVIRYGTGLSFLIYNTPTFRIAPVQEVVGWTALSGKSFGVGDLTPVNAAGQTIVNYKTGVRIGFGRATNPGVISKFDIYAGYGRALTGDVWYKDIWRVEFRYRF